MLDYWLSEGLTYLSASLVHLFTVPRARVYGNKNQFTLNLKTASRSPPIKIGNEHETKLIQRYWSKTFSLNLDAVDKTAKQGEN